MTPADGAPSPEAVADRGGSRVAVARLVAIYVLIWLLVMLGLALAELWLDPDFNKPIGDALNLASIVVAIAGMVLVPIGSIAIARARELSGRASIVAGAAALIAFAVGNLIILAIYVQAGGS